MKDNTFGRTLRRDRDPMHPDAGVGPWHWLTMHRDGYAITYCKLFASLDRLQMRGGLDPHVNHRCSVCDPAWRVAMGFERGGLVALEREEGWSYFPELSNGQMVSKDREPFSRKIRKATQHQKKMEELRKPDGIKAVIPQLRKRLKSPVMPVLVGHDGNNFSAYSPTLKECVATGGTLGEVLTNLGSAMELHLNGQQKEAHNAPQTE